MVLLFFLLGCSGGGGPLPDTAGRFFAVDSAAERDSAAPQSSDSDSDTSSSLPNTPEDTAADTGADAEEADGAGALYATCAAADSGVELTAGSYRAEVSGWTADVDAECAPAGAGGPEVVGRLSLGPLEWVRLSWSVQQRDTVLVLAAGCEPSASCEASQDEFFAGGREQLWWLNESASAVERYALLDTIGPVQDGDRYELKVERAHAVSWTGHDACEAATVVQSGSFLVSLDSGHRDHSALGGACAAAAGAVDTHAQVLVPSGQTLSLHVLELEGAVSTAIVLDCEGSCAAASRFTNTTSTPRLVTVVVEAVAVPARALLVVELE